jgi:hypothetical protein
MKFFKKRNKTLKYVEKLALENVENKKRISQLESQIEKFSELGVKMAERLKDLENAGNIDERLTYLENEQLDRNAIEDIVDDRLPSNIEDICYTYDEYDFSEFVTQADVDETIRDQEFITEDDVAHIVKELVDENLDKHNYEDFLDKWQNPEMFRKFLNKLAKYIASQTEC